jgi:hypothetical protein
VTPRKVARWGPGAFDFRYMKALSALKRLLLSTRARRVQHRTPSSIPVDWRVFGSKVHHLTILADLSPGGAFVRAPDPRPVGSPIVIDLATPRGIVNVHARVAWKSPQGMGIRFTRLLPGL